MRIWTLDCDVDNYETLTWEQNIDIEYIQSFDGTKKKENWNPIKVMRVYDRKFSNTPGLSPHIPVFDEKAITVLGDLITENAEILQLDCEYGKFYAINITNVRDCIDYEKSIYKTFRDGKRIMRFIKYVFNKNQIEGVNLFKIKDEPLKRPFVSENFRNRVLENSLTGFKFELVWDSDGV